MCVSRSNFLAVFFVVLMLGVPSSASIIVPGSLTEINRQADSDPISYDSARNLGDPYWNDRSELIGAQGKITDAMTGKTMLGLEGLLLSNDAKDTQGNAAGENYEIKFQIEPTLTGKARVYVMIGIRDVFNADPEDWLQGRLNDNAYSPRNDIANFPSARTWIGLNIYGVPVGPVFNRILRRPGPDARPMAFPVRDGVGEEYFAFYHDFNPGEMVGIYGCYAGGSNYQIFAEMTPPDPPAIWTSADIGSTMTGDTQFNAATERWDVYADGGDIWDSADAFRYVYTQASGDFMIQGRMVGFSWANNDWGKAGFMMRESTAANSVHASIFARAPNDFLGIQYRGATGSGSGGGTESWFSPVLPKWLRWQRTGNVLTASTSNDAVTWTQFGQLPGVPTTPVLVGMAVTSHNTATIAGATFERVYVTGQAFAHAGFDQSVDQGAVPVQTFILDGSASMPEGAVFLWEQLAGAPNVIPNPALPTQTISTADINIFGDQTFIFRLTVTNSATGAKQTATIKVFVKDKEQVNAGPDQTTGEGARVDFSGSATGVITSWLWEQVAGPSVSPFMNTTQPNAWFFTGNYANDQVLQFKLSINGGEDWDFVDVKVIDAERALANAGPDFPGYEMRTLQLDATGSNTRDNAGSGALTYAWTQTGGPSVYKFAGTNTAKPTFIAPEIPLTVWPDTRALTFKVTITAPNGSTDSDTVVVTDKDAEFETVFYREHEDFDFHNSLVNGKWYPERAVFGERYGQGAVGNKVYGMPGRMDPSADYWWNNTGGDTSYRPGAQLGNDAQVASTSGTAWKAGWINPGENDYWKFTFELPHGSTKAYIVNWMATDTSWHGNSRAYYDLEAGNTSPVGYFRVARRGWENYAPFISPPFQVNAGLHKITLDAYGGGEPNYARFEFHVPMPDATISDAGVDKGAASGELVTLDGRGSQTTGTAWAWEQLFPATPAITINNANSAVATFTAPTVTTATNFLFRLTVTGLANSGVDFVTVTVIPAGLGFSLFADQRGARDTTAINWGDRTLGGAEWGSAYMAGNWGALPARRRLSSNVVVHHNEDTDGSINLTAWSEMIFNLPAGSAGDYYFYLRMADQNGDSAYVRSNEGLMGIWPTDTPSEDRHRVANDDGYRGQFEWYWARITPADTTAINYTVPLIDGENRVRIYGRESHCSSGGWPFTWDAMIFSKVDLNSLRTTANFDLMDGVARAAQIAGVTLVANAGPDFNVYEGQTAALDGSNSLGAITSWLWGQTGGPAVTITNANQPVATFVAPNVTGAATLTFNLTVGDGTKTASDTVIVTVLNVGVCPAPTNLTAEGVELGILLKWTAAPGAQTYKILRRDLGIPWPYDTLVVEDVTATQFTDKSMPLYMDQLYSYTVIGVNAFGESAPALPAQGYALSANLALRSDAAAFNKRTNPYQTFGNQMNNRAREENVDSWYNDELMADDWWGYKYPAPIYFQEIHYYPGNVFSNGGWWTSLGVQFTKDGVFWYNIPNVTITPAYQFSPDTPDGRGPGTPDYGQLPYIRRHIIKFPKVEGIAVRIYGAPGGSSDFTSMAELELYGVPGPEGYLYSYAGADFSADEGTTATLNGTDSSTPRSVKYHWEQITGAAGQVTQLNLSSVANADVIWAKGEVLANQDAFEPDGANFVYTSNPDVGPFVLPADGKVGPYQLGSYTAKNIVLLSQNQRSSTIPVPAGNYGYLGVAFAGASGNHMTTLTLNYANGDLAIPFEFSDWFNRGDQLRVVEETYRVNRQTGAAERQDGTPVGGPNIYHRVLPVDSAKTLLSVTFSGFAGSGNQTGGIFAMNLGPAVPVLVLSDPNAAVCTFPVPDLTSDQYITFKLSVWDVANNLATDEVVVHLVDIQKGVANAGADAIGAAPFTSVILDGSGTTGNIIWYRWEQIGGTPAVALWNTDQAKATIIAPDAGAWMYFKVTAAAANGTVTSDTMVVTSAYGLPAGLPAVPASGFIQDVLVLGANYSSRFTTNLDVNYDHLASNGGQANQLQPSAGETINVGGETFVDGPAVWTEMHRTGDVGGTPGGAWFASEWGWPLGLDNFIGYFHVYIISPSQRDARAILRHDDEMRCWNNGALAFGRDGWDGGVEVSSDFTLSKGVNSMTFKLHEGGGGNYLAVRFTDRNNAQYSDLTYVLSYRQLLPPVLAYATPDPPEPVVVEAGDVFYLDGRASTSGTNVDYEWTQVWPQDPEFIIWFPLTNAALFGAPMVEEDTDFYFRIKATDGVNTGYDAVKVTVATKELPGAVTGATGEWAGDVGAVLRWSAADHASRYIIERAEAAAGPYAAVGTAYTNMFVDVGPLAPTTTYYYRIVPANILSVGTGVAELAITRDPNVGNVALSDLATPIVGQPNPQGGGSRDIGIMKDGIVDGQNYDTYDGNTPNPGSKQGEETFEFFGYLLDKPVTVHSLVFYTGGVFGDGGWWTLIGVQVTTDRVTWQDASGVVSGPVYDTADSGSGRGNNEKYIFSIIPDSVTGVRIAGHAGGSARFVSGSELHVYAEIGGLTVNAGADGTANELAVVTLDGSGTTGATSFLWEQVSGPTIVINTPTQQVASFTAPAVTLTGQVTVRLTASNAQWSAWDEVTFTIMDVNSWHIYRYTADFDGRTALGALVWAGAADAGTGRPGDKWVMGYAEHTKYQYMRGKPANEAPSSDAVAGNDYFFQATSQNYQQYRPTLNPFDIRFFGPGEVDPFIGYTTVNDWWNYTFGTTKTELTGVPFSGVMSITALAASGTASDTIVEVFMDEVKKTEIKFWANNWGDFQWRPGTDTWLVAKGQHTIRLRLSAGGWDFGKFRLDLVVPQIQQIIRFDGMVTVIWNDVGRIYTVQAAAVPGGPWVDVYGPTTETSVTSPIPPERRGFYRIKVQ
jgi:hypothetical protein